MRLPLGKETQALWDLIKPYLVYDKDGCHVSEEAPSNIKKAEEEFNELRKAEWEFAESLEQ